MSNETEATAGATAGEPAVAVIGAGTMGSAIARRLRDAGLTVGVWDRNKQHALALADLGATAFDDPKDAVKDATVVLTLLPTADVVTEVMLGRGVVDAMSAGAVWAQMGTVGVGEVERLDAEVRARRPEIQFVDAPVSGSQHPAETGQLLVLASGPETAMSTVAPIFDAIGRRTLWLGPAGTGSRLKLVLNTWLAFEVEAAAEAAAVATRLEIDPQALADAIAGNPLASPLATAKLSKMQSADDRAEFALEWALKDLDLMRETVGTSEAPIAIAIANRWRSLVDQGFGSLDVSAARLGLGEEPTASAGGERAIAGAPAPS
jgi:3-hydroxyisobutyrate dehydrogenase